MRTGYEYDDDIPSVQGSYVNNQRKKRKFTGEKLAEIVIDPITKEIHFEYDKSKWTNEEDNGGV